MNLCEFNYSKVLTTLQQLKDVNSKISNTLDELNRILESEEELKFIGERLYYTNIDLRKNIINIIFLSPFQEEPWKEPMQIISW